MQTEELVFSPILCGFPHFRVTFVKLVVQYILFARLNYNVFEALNLSEP